MSEILDKEECLKYIKTQTNWNDTWCLDFYENAVKSGHVVQEILPRWYICKIRKNDKYHYSIIKNDIMDVDTLDYSVCYSEEDAKRIQRERMESHLAAEKMAEGYSNWKYL